MFMCSNCWYESSNQKGPIRPDSSPATYLLILQLKNCKQIVVGKLGQLTFQPGFYAYCGSAFGPGGVQARLRHHLRPAVRPHWHLDFLRPFCDIKQVWFSTESVRREHDWAELLQHANQSKAIKRFGASDCRCVSHLFYFKNRPEFEWFKKTVQPRFPNDVLYQMIIGPEP